MAADERAQLIKNMLGDLQTLTPPGMADIKQVELYTKWRSLLKPENKDITCPKPPEEVLKRVRQAKNQKARKRTAEKRKATTKQPTSDSNKE